VPHSVARGFAEAGGDDHQDRDVEETEEMDIDKYPVYPDVFDCLEMHCHDGCYVDWHDRDLVAAQRARARTQAPSPSVHVVMKSAGSSFCRVVSDTSGSGPTGAAAFGCLPETVLQHICHFAKRQTHNVFPKRCMEHACQRLLLG